MKNNKKTNPRIQGLVDSLKAKSREEGVALWRDLAKRLDKPRRRYAEVNLSSIDRHTSKDEIVVVPGKVLGAGSITHPVTVAALGFSSNAAEKIRDAKGNVLSIEDLMTENPKGSGVRIIQ